MNNIPQRIAIYGGSFDPIHTAHLILAQTAVEQLSLDLLYFIPSGGKAHYKSVSNQASSTDRFNMLQLAIGEHPCIRVSDYEIRQGRFCYTIETLRYFRSLFPAGTEIFLLAGQDWKDKIQTWKEGDAILREFKVALFSRPLESGSLKPGHLSDEENVILVNMPLIEISSTEIRQRVRENESIQYRVPEPVRQYILEHKLYLEVDK
ncbi:MAG: nicotinate (nicotinamide) nucleotide adenylyltransferase [bacterium]